MEFPVLADHPVLDREFAELLEVARAEDAFVLVDLIPAREHRHLPEFMGNDRQRRLAVGGFVVPIGARGAQVVDGAAGAGVVMGVSQVVVRSDLART